LLSATDFPPKEFDVVLLADLLPMPPPPPLPAADAALRMGATHLAAGASETRMAVTNPPSPPHDPIVLGLATMRWRPGSLCTKINTVGIPGARLSR
jgi:hypothetical protein